MKIKPKAFLTKIAIAVLIGLGGYLLWLPFSLHSQRWGRDYMTTRHEDWGIFGDYVGGIIGTILTCATLLFLIYQDHKTKRRLSKEDTAKRLQEIISVHRNVLTAIKMHAYEGGVAIPKEGVEALWRLYAGHYLPLIHSPLIEAAKAHVISDDHSWREMVQLGAWPSYEIPTKDVFLEKLDWWSNIFVAPNKVYAELTWRTNLNAITACLPPETAQSISASGYGLFFQSVGYIFGHYHRNLFYVLRELDEAPFSDAEKERQGKIFRSMLSGAELVMIHLNIYCDYDQATSGSYPFRELVKKYEILEDLDKHMFAHREVYKRDTRENEE